ncbi:MAG: DoxX family protein [Aquisalimonadaceae bacterium]
MLINDDLGKLILRLTLGILILLHGLAKITGGIGGIQGMLGGAGLPGFIAYGVYLGEVLGPIMIMIGWHTRIGALLIAINMLFAIGLAHTNELFAFTGTGGWALELQGMFLLTAVALIFTGPGAFSINRK